jgi:dipeptidyl aminopeptidase/acylaminoacyl peptidase
MHWRIGLSAVLITISASASALTPLPSNPQQALTLDQIMAHPDWIGTPIEAAWWSLDSEHVLYRQKRLSSPLRDVYRLPAASGQAAMLDDAQLADLDPPSRRFNANRTRAVFVRNGDVFVRDLNNHLQSKALIQVTRNNESEDDAFFTSDQQSVIYRRGNEWYRASLSSLREESVLSLKAEASAEKKPDYLQEMQLRLIQTLKRQKDDRDAQRQQSEAQRKSDPTRAPQPINLGEDVDIVASMLSPNLRYAIAVTETKGENGRTGKMPKYVTESGYEEVEDVRTRVGKKAPKAQRYFWIDIAAGKASEIDLSGLPTINQDPLAALRKANGVKALSGLRALRLGREDEGAAAALQFSPNGEQLAIQLRAVDNKDRWIALLSNTQRAPRTLHRLRDEAWINWNYNEYGWLSNDRLWYMSEESGYSHLYTRGLDANDKARALTQGRWEASSVQWSPDQQTAYFVCNQQWPGDYEVCSVSANGGSVREWTSLDGVEDFSLSPNGSAIALRYSASYLPAQLATLNLSNATLSKRTDTRSEAFKQQQWMQPEYVQVPSTHGAGTIWAKLYKPAQLQPGKKYPIVMFVHGAGYLQNVFARYPNYFREQMFHNMLVQRGYIVLDMDFRASEGYGRNWRTAIYRQMGHPELEDYVDGAKWMAEKHQGDIQNIGIYGGSYGGFMSFMALFREPDLFKSGAALRPVTDWTQYNHEYTSNILNTPEIDPDAYKKSSPIEYAENLRGHLLISHGMMDDNVFYQDSVRLSQRLIELKKDKWEMASYPLERHGYQQPESWYDQYRRIFELFERTLK